MRRSDFLKGLKGPDYDNFDRSAGITEFRQLHPWVYERIKGVVGALKPEMQDYFLLSRPVLFQIYALYRRDPRSAEEVLSHLANRINLLPQGAGHGRVRLVRRELDEYLANELSQIPHRFPRAPLPAARKVSKIKVLRPVQATAPRVRFRRLKK